MATDDPTTAIRELAEALRDVSKGLADIDRRLVISDTRADERKGDVARLTLAVERIESIVERIEAPVIAMVEARTKANEREEAERGRWALLVSPERVRMLIKYVGIALTALGIGGGIGANFRGCGAVLTTASDSAPPPVQVAPPSGTVAP